jgi:dolichol kinase
MCWFPRKYFILLFLFKGNHKSIEGTLSFILSQAIFYYLLHIEDFFYLGNPLYLSYVIISIIVSAIVETFSKDNDNLLLSISVYPFLLMIR